MLERSLPLVHNDFLMRIKTPASTIASFYPFEDYLCPCPLSCLVCSFPFSHPNHIYFFFLVNSTHVFKSDGESEIPQVCPTLCNPMDYSPPGCSVHGIFQARVLEWLSCPLPGDLPNPGIKLTSLESSALAGVFFTTSASWEAEM